MFRLTIRNEQHEVVFSGDYTDRRNAIKTMFARCSDCRCEALNDEATDFELARWNWLYWRNAGHASIVHLQ